MAGELSEADLLSQLENLASAVRHPRRGQTDAAMPGTSSPERSAPERLAPGPKPPMPQQTAPARGKLASPPSPTSAEDHRSRLRHRLLTAGPDALADHELLEAVLFLAILRRDTKPIAYRLIARFGSFASAIAAPMNDLLAVDGLGPSGAAALKTVHAAALRLSRP